MNAAAVQAVTIIMTSLITISGMALMVYYETHRKFPKERHSFNPLKLGNWMSWLDRNWPRVLFSFVVAPAPSTLKFDWVATKI